MALQIRRGTNAERQSIIPLQGELIFTTDTKKLFIGDGTTTGGIDVDTGSGGGGATDLNGLSDVVLTSPSNGQVLKYNGSNWVNLPDATGGSSLASLDDVPGVVLTSPSNGEVLKYNGTNWVNLPDATGSNAVLSVNGQTGAVSLSTTNINEGTNQYFTNERSQDATATLFSNGTHSGITFTYDDVSNKIDANVTLSSIGPFSSTGLTGNVNTNNFNIVSTGTNNITLSPAANTFVTLDGNVDIVGNLRRSQAGNLAIFSATGGNVIIGIATASDNYEGNLAIVRNNYDGAFGKGFLFQQFHNTPDSVNFDFNRGRGTTLSPAAVQSGDDLIDLTFTAYDGVNNVQSASIGVRVEGVVNPPNVPTKFQFFTNNGTSPGLRAELSPAGVWKVNSIEGLTSPTSLSLTGNVTTPSFLKLAVYADDTARSTGIPTPTQGMVIFMQSGTAPAATNQMQVYDGTSWVNV